MGITTSALSALAGAQKQLADAAEGVRRATQPADQLADQLDLSSEAVRLLAEKTSYKAAIELAKTADEIERHTLDLIG